MRTLVPVFFKIVAAYSWFFAHGNIFCFLCVMVLDKNSFFLKGFEKYMLSFTVRLPVPERHHRESRLYEA
jgi:hypothetical protein